MNVVGKVGSLISQGVYSVATPFHPFGGAVDIVVVQQQDGSFRSTPWYVRFGKFQGVLKGAEKVVRINVNGVEANFHMYLDNSGEAYFIQEVDSGQDVETNGLLKDGREGTQEDSNTGNDKSDCVNNGYHEAHRLQSTLSDPGVVTEEFSSMRPTRLERAESDACNFYDFQDDPSSFDIEGSVELSSEYGSNRFESLDAENFVEAQCSDSEMVLFSVDGHVLTAPILSSEHNTEAVELGTPQFHLGPGESTEFCEGSGEFSVSEKAWATGYLNNLKVSSSKIDSADTGCLGENSNPFERESSNCDEQKDVHQDLGANGMCQLDACKEDGAAHQDQGTDGIFSEERDLCILSDVVDALGGIYGKDRFSSSSKPLDLSKQAADNDLLSKDHPLDIQKIVGPEEMPSQGLQASNYNESEHLCEKHSLNELVANEADNRGLDGVLMDNGSAVSVSCSHSHGINQEEQHQKFAVGVDTVVSDCISAGNNLEHKDEHVSMGISDEVMQNGPAGDAPEMECNGNKIVEPQVMSSIEEMPTRPGLRCEISLCGHLLSPGMGLGPAAEAFDAYRISEEEYKRSMLSIIKNENLVIRFKERYLSWDKAAPIMLGWAAFGLDLPVETKDAIPVVQQEPQKLEDNDLGSPSTSGRRWRLWPIPFRRSKAFQRSSSNASTEEVFLDSVSVSQDPPSEPILSSQSSTAPSDTYSKPPHKRILRTNIPTSEQIASLNLKEGQNMVTFSFSTRVLGLQQVDAHIYLWKWNARIVISDVDGTITKSDVLGQFMPLVGRDWTQSGVARLFSAIKENGYQLLFLSARAIVQAYLTRNFLLNLKQDGKTLPNGPVVISPDGLFPSLYREVIRRAPHEFKIACLEDIKALFPHDYNPFYAGFGNRDTDELSYRKIGIPKGKIFIINPKGEVAINNRNDVKSYTSLHTLVNDMFPPTSMVEQEDYNSWNYWRMPLPEIDE
ncbi:hypothetical protein Ancab_031943 [Ancistrocladus abbreviatus]